MKPSCIKQQLFLTALMLLLITGLSKAQSVAEPKNDLYTEIAKMDSILFTAFNKRDAVQFKKFFNDSLEFYHDKGGLTGYDQTVNFLNSLIESKSDLKRELVPGTLEVYPIPNYGAMEIGSHRFCHTENGKQDCGTFKFVHIWQKKDGQWKITRVVSYDH